MEEKVEPRYNVRGKWRLRDLLFVLILLGEPCPSEDGEEKGSLKMERFEASEGGKIRYGARTIRRDTETESRLGGGV